MNLAQIIHYRFAQILLVCGVGIILVAWGLSIKPNHNSSATTPSVVLESDDYQNITAAEFASRYLRDVRGYAVRISDGVKAKTKKSSFGAVKDYPIRKILKITSKIWGIKYYLSEKEIFVYSGEEEPADTVNLNQLELIYVKPLPIDKSIKFSQEESMCGPNCLALLAYTLGKPTSVQEIADKISGKGLFKGSTLLSLAQAAKSLDLKAKGVKMPLDAYKKLKAPIIIHLDTKFGGHFVIIEKYNDNGTFTIIDPPNSYIYSPEKLEEKYTGNALLIWK